MQYTRREVIKLGLAALPAAELTPVLSLGAELPAKPYSVFGGVQVGVIAPYSFRGVGNNPEDLLKAIFKLGLSAVELQSEGFEAWAGAPAGGRGFGATSGAGGRGGRGGRGGQGGGGGPGGPGGLGGFGMNIPDLTEAQQAALREMNESLAPLNQTLTAARAALSTATFAAKTDVAGIKSKAETASPRRTLSSVTTTGSPTFI